jgi:hypothetical protein
MEIYRATLPPSLRGDGEAVEVTDREPQWDEAPALSNEVGGTPLQVTVKRTLSAVTAAWADLLPLFADGLPLPSGEHLRDQFERTAKGLNLTRSVLVVPLERKVDHRAPVTVPIDLWHGGAVDAARVAAAWRLTAASRWIDETRRRLKLKRHTLSPSTLQLELKVWKAEAQRIASFLDAPPIAAGAFSENEAEGRVEDMVLTASSGVTLHPEGLFNAVLVGVEEAQSQFEPDKTQVRLNFETQIAENGATTAQRIALWCNATLTPKSKLRPIVETLLGRNLPNGEEVDFDSLAGTSCRVFVEHYKNAAGETRHRIAKVLKAQ